MEKFKKIHNASASDLVLAMRNAVDGLGFYAQRDTISDISDLLGLVDLYRSSRSDAKLPISFFRFWGLREDGTVMCRVNDFGEWEPQIVARYLITWSSYSGFSIEQTI